MYLDQYLCLSNLNELVVDLIERLEREVGDEKYGSRRVDLGSHWSRVESERT